jgi:hypothetical protein
MGLLHGVEVGALDVLDDRDGKLVFRSAIWRTIAGTRSRPAIWAARTRRSPATSW